MKRLLGAAKLMGFVAAMLAARSSLADHYTVPTGSMIPTVAIDDRVVVNKLAYGLRVPFSDLTIARWSGPRRGDVIVLTSPEDGHTVLLKRVVAGPGDEVLVRGGRVWLAGVPVPLQGDTDAPTEHLGRPHVVQPGGPDFGPRRLGPDEYLVMGDNRRNSHDGRDFGLVSRSAVLGRAVAVYWRGGPVWRSL
jgi:signal peptidase I